MEDSGTGRVLVLNCGSSTVKYRLLEPGTGQAAAWGAVDRVGQAGGRHLHHVLDPAGKSVTHLDVRDFPDNARAVDAVLAAFAAHGPCLDGELAAVGHRVVHGGE